jgi:serine/threonine protein kinase/predicted Zn-dependent protease
MNVPARTGNATAAQWQRVKNILADALERPSPEERTAYLKGSCGNDTTLMREVEALLAQSTQNLDQLADNTPMAFTRQAPAQPTGRRIGTYEIVREIGRGGMGAVYLARRADGQFEKNVAIKLLKRGTDTDEILRRFQAERQILARLDHPNIARLLDAGTTDDGLPYFVMEHVAGVPITRHARESHLSLAQRLRLFLKVCEAVQFAHQRLVVHRDLKPGNILVTRDGEPKLLDFGIAKLLASGEETTELTLTTERRFTPVCASPEQTRGEPVTPATDVYALGALLYELLTNQPPHRFSSPHPSSDEIERVVCYVEPVRPSLAVDKADLRRQLRGDLDIVTLTALAKEPASRYVSARAIAEDIQQYLSGRPIVARKSRAPYRAWRFIRRNYRRIATALMLAGIGLLLGFLLFRSASQPRAQIQQIRAEDNPEQATRDAGARRLFLQARTLVYEFGTGAKYQESLTNAVQLLENAVARDPKFSLAYSLLAEAHLYLYRDFEHTDAHLHAGKEAADAAQRLAPESGAAHFAQAVYFYDGERDLPRAESEITAALGALPTRVDALEVATKVESRLGRWKEAIEHGEKAVELDPRDPALIPSLVQSYTALRRYVDAERVIDRALGVLPPQFAAPLWRSKAVIALAQGNVEAARAALQSSPVNTPREDYIRLQIAILERDFDGAQAIANKINVPAMEPSLLFWRGVMARATGDDARARETFAAAATKIESELRDRPNDPDLLSYLALSEAGAGEKDKALQQTRHALEVCPIAKDAIDGAKVATIEAKVYAWLGQNDIAITKLVTLVKIPAGPDYGHLALSPEWDVLRADERFAQLLEQARRPIDPISARNEIASNPPTSDLVAYDLYLRGNALMDDIATSTDWEGDNRRAIELLDRAVTHDPGFALAYARLSDLHLNLYQWVDQTESRLAQAKAALQQAMRLAPDAPETHIAEALSATATGDCKHALDLLRGVQRERPDDAFVVQQIGQTEECIGMWREGLQDMERAKQLAPRNSNIPNHLKEMYSAVRDYRNSDRVCDEAIAQFPNGPNYYRAHKVANSLARGDTGQARARLAEIPEKFDPSGYRSLLSLMISFAERDFDRFTREVANTPWEHFIEEMKVRGDFVRALVAEHQGNRPLLESIVLPLREKLAGRKEPPGRRGLSPAPSVLANVARLDCYLNHNKEALSESDQAVSTRTAPVDAPGAKLVRAEVLMRAGQTERAVELLEELATVPYGPSHGELMTLRWDSLRANPRFERIVNQLAATAK